MKYFEECRTAEELKEEYRRLCKELHPDRGGNKDEFQEMHKCYELRLEALVADSKYAHNSEELKKLRDLLLHFLYIYKPGIYMRIMAAKQMPEVQILAPRILQAIKEVLPQNMRKYVDLLFGEL